MITAKDESYNDELWYQNRITELEHSLQDSEERCKLFEDSGILLSKRITELEQQVEELKKELQANNMFINEKIKNYNSGYEKLVDIKIGSHIITKI